MAQKLTINFNPNNFEDFIQRLKELNNINDTIKVKISREKILMYSTISNETAVLALKTFSFDTNKYIDNFDEDFTLDFIITGSGRVIKSLNFFDNSKLIKCDVIYKESTDSSDIMLVRSAQFSSGRLKISIIGAESYKIRDLNQSLLDKRLDIKNSIWSFKTTNSDFLDIKRLSSINSEDRIIEVNVTGGIVKVAELGKWELEVDEIESKKNYNLSFLKKYLGNINMEEDFIHFYIFDTFILVKDNNSNLMLSYEQDFEVEN
jgi:hypothetical protein